MSEIAVSEKWASPLIEWLNARVVKVAGRLSRHACVADCSIHLAQLVGSGSMRKSENGELYPDLTLNLLSTVEQEQLPVLPTLVYPLMTLLQCPDPSRLKDTYLLVAVPHGEFHGISGVKAFVTLDGKRMFGPLGYNLIRVVD
jgi:hypothetical protein